MTSVPVLFHPEVAADIKTYHRWYRDIAPELALAFDASLAATVRHIERFPKMYAEVEVGIRRVTLSRFPYQIFYHPGDACVQVLGFYHSHSDPEMTTAKVATRWPATETPKPS